MSQTHDNALFVESITNRAAVFFWRRGGGLFYYVQLDILNRNFQQNSRILFYFLVAKSFVNFKIHIKFIQILCFEFVGIHNIGWIFISRILNYGMFLYSRFTSNEWKRNENKHITPMLSMSFIVLIFFRYFAKTVTNMFSYS